MNGLNKIIDKLNADCEKQCADIISSAEAKATEDYNKSAADSLAECELIIANAQREANEIVRLAHSTAEITKKQTILRNKVLVLDSVVDSALNELCSLPNDKYKAVMAELITKNAMAAVGVMMISSSDEAVFDADFISQINSSLSGSNISVKVSPEMKDKGVLLVYGDIEINLTFKAIFSSSRDSLKQTAREIVFP